MKSFVIYLKDNMFKNTLPKHEHIKLSDYTASGIVDALTHNHVFHQGQNGLKPVDRQMVECDDAWNKDFPKRSISVGDMYHCTSSNTWYRVLGIGIEELASSPL